MSLIGRSGDGLGVLCLVLCVRVCLCVLRCVVMCRVVSCRGRANSPQEELRSPLSWSFVVPRYIGRLDWDGRSETRHCPLRCVASRRQGTGVESVSISPIVTSVRTGFIMSASGGRGASPKVPAHTNWVDRYLYFVESTFPSRRASHMEKREKGGVQVSPNLLCGPLPGTNYTILKAMHGCMTTHHLCLASKQAALQVSLLSVCVCVWKEALGTYCTAKSRFHSSAAVPSAFVPRTAVFGRLGEVPCPAALTASPVWFD